MNFTQDNPVTSLNVSELLDKVPAARAGTSLVPMLLMVGLVAILVTAGGHAPWIQALMPLVLALVMVLAFLRASRVAGQQRQEHQYLREVDETIRLGRWSLAGKRLVEVLDSSTQRPQVRFQALIYLGSALNHEGRFEDVERVYDHLLQNAQLTPPIAFSIRCARAYAWLREDRLTDAYEAISQLRRDPQAASSAMLGLLEMYRMIKTAHHDDALQLFEQRRSLFAQQLGHRSCDAWVLAAVAANGLGRWGQAALFARNALLLGQKDDMAWRFPEAASLLQGLANADKSAEGAGR